MSKIWMTSGVVTATLVVAMAWGAEPRRSSRDWLAKAQSEFASKGRDAVLRRRGSQGIVQITGQNASQETALAADDPVRKPSSPVVVVAADPVRSPLATVIDPSTAAVAPPVKPPLELPAPPNSLVPVEVATHANAVVTPVPAEISSFGKKVVSNDRISLVGPQPDARDQSSSRAAQVVPLPLIETKPSQPRPVADAMKADEPVIGQAAPPAAVAADPRERAHPKTRRMANTDDRRAGPLGTSIEARGLKVLRQHAPEIAAMIRRSM